MVAAQERPDSTSYWTENGRSLPGSGFRGDAPTLIMHGDDDQIVPIADSASLSSKLVPGATLKVYKGQPHGMCQTNKDEINTDLLAFIKQGKQAAA